MPGALEPVGRWLSEAEALLGTEEKLNGKPDEVLGDVMEVTCWWR